MKIFVRVKLSKLLKIFIIIFISSLINAEDLASKKLIKQISPIAGLLKNLLYSRD